MASKELQVIKRRKVGQAVVAKSESGTLIDRFLTDPFGSWQGLSTLSQRSLGEVEETKDAYIFLAELPGTSMEEVKVNVHGKHLTISAEHHEHYGKDGDDHNFRRSSRSFQQIFALPDTVDPKKIVAQCKNGLLRVVIPKKARLKEVTVASKKTPSPLLVNQRRKNH